MDTQREVGNPGERARHVVHVIATEQFAGVERYATYVAPLLVGLGWRVTVVGGERSSMRLALDGSGVVHVPYEGRAQLGRWLAEAAADIDLVHAHMTDAEFVSVRALRGSSVPIVATRHFARRRGRNGVRRLLLRRFGQHFAAQISISQFVAKSIGESSVVIPNGVPEQPEGAHQQKTVLVAQRLEPEKSTDVALRAFAASGIATDGWELHIAGTGSQEPDLRRLALELGLGSSVRFLGFVRDVPERIAECGLYLAPSPIDAFGLTVAEAMAAATPVCGANVGGHRELFGGINPAVFEPGNVFEAAQALRQLVGDEQLRRRTGRRLQERQRAEFSVAVHAARLGGLYREILGQAPEGSS